MINTENISTIFNYYAPSSEFIGILSIPHSGEEIPPEFRPYLSDNVKDLMQDVDFRVHELIDIEALQKAGIAVIKSNIIRTAVDLNRPKEKATLNWKQNTKSKTIVIKSPTAKESAALTDKYYAPYYELIKALITELQAKTTTPSLIDLHSMPSQAEEYHLKITPNQEKHRPDFCLSDISGISCEEGFLMEIGKNLNLDYPKVYYNNPYFGGNITRFLHATYKPLNNIQIEISRAIYMSEESQTLVPAKVTHLKPILTEALISHFKKWHTSI